MSLVGKTVNLDDGRSFVAVEAQYIEDTSGYVSTCAGCAAFYTHNLCRELCGLEGCEGIIWQDNTGLRSLPMPAGSVLELEGKKYISIVDENNSCNNCVFEQDDVGKCEAARQQICKTLNRSFTDCCRNAAWIEEDIKQKAEPMQTNATVAIKHDGGKMPMSLLSREALEQTAKVLAFGREKYASHNWRNGFVWSRTLDALLRHTIAFMEGEDVDPESGLSHMAHAMCNCMFLLEFIKTHPELDDRWKPTV